MKGKLTLILIFWTLIIYGQNKYDFVNFDMLVEVEGTEYVIASAINFGKKVKIKNSYLLFINTKSGLSNQVNFTVGANINEVKQVKLDSLGINKIIVVARTINVDGKNEISWNDPQQIFLLSPDGKEKTQITDNKLFVKTWVINNESGTIIIAGHYDTNNNGKYDKKDKNEICIYDLKTLKLVNKI